MDSYRLSLEGVCRDIGLRRLPDPGGPPTPLSYIRSLYLVTHRFRPLYLPACIVVVLLEHLSPVTAGSVFIRRLWLWAPTSTSQGLDLHLFLSLISYIVLRLLRECLSVDSDP
jgi:hypothetical protein